MVACNALGVLMGLGITVGCEAVTEVLVDGEEVHCFGEVMPMPDADPQTLVGLFVA